ncbi:cation transporter [Neisseria meningitidis]|uniref:cation transporter n=1 Tax=Neisseria meningitidis TaxID=487 RepID=UPI0005E57EC7|nr:cation diffusion facilitator family transporter [Neisseria meningitidis]CKK59750.1 putative heavy metal transport protein [Neisseria meningitidis]CKL00616.1 putative heavy metal transport protein [Neisseria meningitidis]CKL47881.1 putative heavy metal transport protein [Neisseria meningitidis]
MKKTIFNITKMDCPSEEQLIRMRLKDVSDIYELQFDIAGRCLTVYHDNQDTTILQVLEPLNFDSHIISTEVIVDKIVFNKPDEHLEKRLLYQVLMINFVFFIIECSVGIFANSMGLIADSLDMLADSFVYILALSAIGMTLAYKKRVAFLAGITQIILALFGVIEVIRRFIGAEQLPNYQLMIGTAFLALIANWLCLYLLSKNQNKEIHIKASMIFTSNDIIINIGVIAAGALTLFTHSSYPDLIIGMIVFVIVLFGARNILKLAK